MDKVIYKPDFTARECIPPILVLRQGTTRETSVHQRERRIRNRKYSCFLGYSIF
jgi:hypothetical protein